MNRRPQDNADELVQKLSEVVRENALSQGEPEDVFSDAGASDESRDSDAQIAAFDTYMASLLGELGIEDGKVADGELVSHGRCYAVGGKLGK